MDAAFYKERARYIRNLASEADPFIKRRLLSLASNYDAMATPHAGEPISPNAPGFFQRTEEITERKVPLRDQIKGTIKRLTLCPLMSLRGGRATIVAKLMVRLH